jgi:hypothetical protein
VLRRYFSATEAQIADERLLIGTPPAKFDLHC